MKKKALIAIVIVVAIASIAYIMYTGGGALPSQPLVYEDLTTYNHNGEPSGSTPYLSMIGNDTIQITDMPRLATCYFQRPINIVLNDFTMEFNVTASELQGNTGDNDSSGGFMAVMFAKNLTTTNNYLSQIKNDGLLFTFREWTGYQYETYYLLQIRSRSSGQWKEYIGALNTNYHIMISRVGTEATMKIYQNNNLVATKTITDTTEINYFLPMCGRGGGGADLMQASGFVSQFAFT